MKTKAIQNRKTIQWALCERRAQVSVADRWLKFAAAEIAAGRNPAKLSECAKAYALAEYEPNGWLHLTPWNEARTQRVADGALGTARHRLPEFPSVLEYFKSLQVKA